MDIFFFYFVMGLLILLQKFFFENRLQNKTFLCEINKKKKSFTTKNEKKWAENIFENIWNKIFLFVI